MKEWFKEHLFILRSYFWAFVAEMIFLCIWDWQVPHTTWGYNLPFFVKYIPAILVFMFVHSVQVWWHVWRKHKLKEITGR